MLQQTNKRAKNFVLRLALDNNEQEAMSHSHTLAVHTHTILDTISTQVSVIDKKFAYFNLSVFIFVFIMISKLLRINMNCFVNSN